MDVTNPGLVNVADEVEAPPDPNGGTSQWEPRETGVLEDVAADGYPLAPNAPPASVFPTPDDVEVTGVVPLNPVDSSLEPDAAEVNVDEQSIGQGGMVPVDPLNPAAGYEFRSPDEFVVVGPTESFQTNRTETDHVSATVAAVLDADSPQTPVGPSTTRYLLLVSTPPLLTSYPVSLLGRQIVFADDTLTLANQGAARLITNYGGNFVAIDRDDPAVSNGDVAELDPPQVGDVFQLYVGRQGSEDVSTTSIPAVDVVVDPPPPDFVPSPAQAQQDEGTVDVSTGPQPGLPVIGSGVQVPTAVNHQIPDQYVGGPGLPANVFV
jgi:hypothetical protein